MRVGSWSSLKACLRIAPAIMAVGMAANAGRSQQQALATNGAQGSYFVYIGTYTEHTSKGIYQYRFDEKTGSLTAMGLAAEIANPSFLVTGPGRRHLFALTEMANRGSSTPGSTVSSYSIDPNTGALTLLNRVPSGGKGPAHLTLDKTGKILFVANYDNGSVASFAINDDATIGAMTAMDQHKGSSVNPDRQKGPHAHAVVVSPDNRFLFVPDLGLDKIFIYKIDLTKHSIAANEPAFVQVPPGMGPRHLAFGADAKFAYAVCEMGASVVAFSYDAAKGSLTPIQTVSILPPGVTAVAQGGIDQGSEIEVDRSGRYLYASNQGPDEGSGSIDGRITVFQIDAKTGLLKPVQFMPSGGKVLRNFVLDPSGKYLLAGNELSGNVVVFTVGSNGQITPTKQVVDVGMPTDLLFVPAP